MIGCLMCVTYCVSAGSCDVSDEPVGVRVTNDTSVVVSADICVDEHPCHTQHEPFLIKPHQVQILNTDDHGVPNVYLITGPGRQVLGCLTLIAHGRTEEPKALISETKPC